MASRTEAAASWSNLELNREERVQRAAIKPAGEEEKKSKRSSVTAAEVHLQEGAHSFCYLKILCRFEAFAPRKEAILHFTSNHFTFISVKNIKRAALPNQTRSSPVLYIYGQTKSLNLLLSVSHLYFLQSFFHFHIQDLSTSLSHSPSGAGPRERRAGAQTLG